VKVPPEEQFSVRTIRAQVEMWVGRTDFSLRVLDSYENPARMISVEIQRMYATFPHLSSPAITFSWPETWWDHVKLRFAPRWALRKWPARFTERKVGFLAVAPDFVVPPRVGRILEFPVFEPSDYPKSPWEDARITRERV
jgi:hypothetical protein